MDITQLLQQKYTFTENITKEEYEYAQASMPPDVFSRSYGTINNVCFRYVWPKESELPLVIMNDTNKKLDQLNKKMKLLYATAIIVICAVGLWLLMAIAGIS